MKLHRLAVRDFRGVATRSVDFPDDGVVVLQGRNEVGKSSLVEALDLLLHTRSDSTAKRVRDVAPRGRDVGTRVEAEITCGPHRFHYAKQFNRGMATELAVLRPQPRQLTGREAHDWVADVLSTHADPDLLRALQFLQADAPTADGLGGSAALSRALDVAAGRMGDDGEGGDLLAGVEEEYLRYYTPTGREARELAEARSAVVAARAEVAAADAAVQEVAQLLSDLAAAQERVRRLGERAHDVKGRRGVAGQAREDVEGGRRRAEHAAGDARLRHAELTTAAERVRRRDELMAARERAAADLDAARGEAERLDRDIEAATEARGEAERLAGAAARAEIAARADLTRARADVRMLGLAAEADAARAQIAEVSALVARLSTLDGRLAADRATDARLRRLREADRECDMLAAQLQVASVGVVVTAADGGEVVIGGERVELDGSAGAERRVARPTEIELPGGFVVTVRPAEQTERLAERLADADARRAELVADAGAESAAAAEAANSRRRALVADRNEVSRRLAAFGGNAAIMRLRSAAATADKALENARLVRDTSAALPADADEAEAVEAAAGAVFADERETLGSARSAASAARERVSDLVERREELRRRLAELERRAAGEASVEGKAEPGDDRSDAGLDAALAEARAAHEAAAAAAETARAALAARDPEAVEREFAAADAALEEWRVECEIAERRVAGLRATIAFAGNEGRQEHAGLAAATAFAAEERLTGVERRARAVTALRETLLRHRDEVRASYVTPFARQIEELGRPVFGEDFQVEVDDDLTIRSRTLGGVTVEFDQLSGGAQEQLGILARLACAVLVDADEGAPVVIDDALGYSDPDRLASMGRVLSTAAGRAQVIVLTCDPTRYASVTSAKVVQLA